MKWLPKLIGFDYEVKYKNGMENSAATDALSSVQNERQLMATMTVTMPVALSLKIEASWETDEILQQILIKLQSGQEAKKHYTCSNGQILRKNKMVVGKDEQLRLKLLAYFHGSSVGGHSGFVKECVTCQRYTPDLAAYPGLLQPLPIPNRIWESISMDFIEGLPRSQGKNVIFVVVDRLTKYAHFMYLAHPFSAAQVAQIFLDIVYKLLGLPTTIVLDRDKVFLSVWSYLRCMTGERPKEWVEWLPLAELWYNSNFYTSIQTIPFQAVYGQTPPIHVPYLGGLSKVDVVDRNLEAREQAIQLLKFHLERSQNRMKQQVDRKRTDNVLKVGDWVLFKLLELPVHAQIHDVVHVSQLKPYKGIPPVTQVIDLPSCDQNGLLVVEPIALLDMKMVKKMNAVVVYGLIQWANRTVEDATWEPLAEIYEKFPTFATHS
ncbi:retrotransposon-related protein [Tanacetum coccineum]